MNRWSLGAVDSSKSVPYVHYHFCDDLESIYKFFDNSSSRSTKLMDIQKDLRVDQSQVTGPGATRWLG